MTGPTLRALRRDYAMDSATSLAARIGCHETTIRRNEKRAQVTAYVLACIDATNTARAFCDGMKWGRDEYEIGQLQLHRRRDDAD